MKERSPVCAHLQVAHHLLEPRVALLTGDRKSSYGPQHACLQCPPTDSISALLGPRSTRSHRPSPSSTSQRRPPSPPRGPLGAPVPPRESGSRLAPRPAPGMPRLARHVPPPRRQPAAGRPWPRAASSPLRCGSGAGGPGCCGRAPGQVRGGRRAAAAAAAPPPALRRPGAGSGAAGEGARAPAGCSRGPGAPLEETGRGGALGPGGPGRLSRAEKSCALLSPPVKRPGRGGGSPRL